MVKSCSELVQLLLAQAPSGASESTVANVEIHSIWDFVVKGGPVMIPIGLCSLIALTVVIERLITLRRPNVIPRGFIKGLTVALESGDRRGAVEYCRVRPSAIARICAAGIKRLDEPVEVIERHIQQAGERETIKLRKHLRVLSLIGSIATLLGLLGTITGMITAFQTVATRGDALGRTELLAGGIYEAMITTAAGLIVAIPVQVCYHWLSAKIERLVLDMDEMVEDFVERHGRPNRVPAAHGNGQLASPTDDRALVQLTPAAVAP